MVELSSANGLAGDNYKITEFRDDAPFNYFWITALNGQFQAEGRQNVTLVFPYTNGPCSGTFNFENTLQV